MASTEEVTDATPLPELFNGALETGVRAVVVLDAAHPRVFEIAKLTWCDHLVVHTADVKGPPSLHPDIPQRTGELLVRRRLVEDGVTLMRRLHLIDATVDAGGIRYQASEEASAFVEGLRTEYAQGKRRILLENYYLPGDLERAVAAFVEHYNHHRYHESLDNLTPADVYFGRYQWILNARRETKRKTIAERRRLHFATAA